jgi:parallel beta-helix repeat protein
MARGLIDNLLISDNIVDGAYRGELEISNYGAAIRIQALEHLRQEFDNAVTLPSCRPSSQCLLFNGVFSHYIGARRPRNVGVTRNKVTNSRSQGIYLSGSTLTHIVDNIISQCDKEALCIDHQSSLNVVSQNIITCTGQRDRQSTRELINDHIDIAEQDAQFVKAKLPAVSIDYSDMNLIWNNSIAGNSGGGIKAVRLACFNVIGCNSLSGNNSGDNDTHVFPEILLGDASVEGTAKRTYRHSFDNRGYGSSANFLVANKITANKRAVQINKSSALNVVAKNQVFGCRDFDFRVANDTSYTVDPSGTLIRLPSGSWPPSKALIL